MIFLALAQAMLLSCAAKTPPPPKPTSVILEIAASPDINPDPSGHPSPVALRVYELESPSSLNEADFMSLYRNDTAVLGQDLTGKLDFILQPGEKKTVRIDEAPQDTQTVGAFAVFRDYEHARWKSTADIRPHETTVVRVKVGGDVLTLGASPAKQPEK